MSKSKRIWKRSDAFTVFSLLATLTLPACVSLSVNPSVICEGTSAATDAHAEALLGANVPDAVVITGDTLIAQLDAACQ